MAKDRAWNDIAPKVQASGTAYMAVIAALGALAALQKERRTKLSPMVNMAITSALALLPVIAGYLKGDDS